VQNRSGSREGRVRSILNLLDRERPDYLVVINTPDAYIAVSRLKARHPKVIMALHGIEPQFYRDIDEFSDVIDAVVVPSRLALDLVHSATRLPDLWAFQIPAGVVTREAKISAPVKPLHIVYSGRIAMDAKRVQDIPPILKVLDKWGVEYELSIAGDGPERIALETELTGVRGKIQFLGILSKNELFDHVYQSGRVLLLTSERETGPLVAWEAMSAGMLVVSSEYRGLKSEGALRDGTNALLFPVGNHEAAAAALVRSQDDGLYTAAARAGQALVHERYSEDRMTSDWSDLLDHLGSTESNHTGALRFDHPADGILARLLGHAMAERVRGVMGIRYRHTSTGGEWPHSYSSHFPSEEYLRAEKAMESSGS
jgi:glycosyltransferase involved in cell wall biosynthesis